MRRIFIGALAIGAVCLFAYWLFLTLASDDTRIRWLIEDMESGFNNGTPSTLADGLAENFSHGESGANRQIVLLGFLQFVQRNSDKEKNFVLRCEVTAVDEIEVDAEADPPTAQATVTVSFFRRGPRSSVDDAGEKVGTVTFEGRLVVEGGNWKIVGVSHRVVEGKRPY